MTKRISFILPIILSFALQANGTVFPSPDTNYLDSVDYYLARASTYTDNALADLAAERAKLSAIPLAARLERLADIGRRFEQIDIDSAMSVYNEAEELALSSDNQRFINIFRYRKGSVMPMMGLVREGIEAYLAVSPSQIDSTDRFDYFTTGHHIFDAAVDYYRVDSLKNKYTVMSNIYADSALTYVKPGSVEETYYKALPRLGGAAYKSGVEDLMAVMNAVDITDPLFAKASAEIARAYSLNNDRPNVRYYLALSALGDLKAGTRETTSLHRLGRLLSDEEDYTRAYDYLAYALESAVASGSSLRTVEIGHIMPHVVKAGREIERKINQTLLAVVIALSGAVFIFVGLFYYTVQTRNRLTRAKLQLANISDSKDRYIKQLLSLCAAYLNALENFNVLAGRKIKVGQISDLMAMIESGKVIRDQLQNFYEVFDDAFMAVYPDFVEQVNALLLPDKKLSLTDDSHLGTELRILAFMRLGLDDSAQIAKFLGLSLNTIYTYRNKVKNRAKDRTSFETNIRNIGRDIE